MPPKAKHLVERQIGKSKIRYVYNPCFDDKSWEKDILAPLPREREYQTKIRWGQEFLPVLDREQEIHLFRQMNYFKHLAVTALDATNLETASLQELQRISELLWRASLVGQQLAQANLALAKSVTKKQCIYYNCRNKLMEAVSDSALSLIDAINLFDFNRGNRFSTYATWVIVRRFQKQLAFEIERRKNETYLKLDPQCCWCPADECERQEEIKHKVNDALRWLDSRQRQVFELIYGNNMEQKEVAAILKISISRVQQLRDAALEKLNRQTGAGLCLTSREGMNQMKNTNA
jgi:RNA polymerase primary sigma factor